MPKQGLSVGARLGRVYVIVEQKWMDQSIHGVYSTIDSALESCYNYFEKTYPNSVWLWDGATRTLENDEDEFHIVFIVPYQVDNDKWRDAHEH